jgi:hypothetical protein
MTNAEIKPGMTVWRWHAADSRARPYLVIAVDGGSAFLRYTGGKRAPHSGAFGVAPTPESMWSAHLHATEGDAIEAQAEEARKSADWHRRAAVDFDEYAKRLSKDAAKLHRQAVKAGYTGPKQ